MAKLPKSKVVLRFVFGQGVVKRRQRYENTSRAIVENVALNMVEDEYENFKNEFLQRVETDVRAELVHMAALYRRHIIGASGTKNGPTGTLSTVSKGESPPSQSLSASLPAWAPRSAKYLQSKRAATGNIKWFTTAGWKAHPDPRYASVRGTTYVPDQSGLLFKESRADTWETMFGPIKATFRRNNKGGTAIAGFSSGGKRYKTQLGTVYVRALGTITPDMLPGFTSGNVHGGAQPTGLINLIYKYDPSMGNRLGRMRNGVYRATLEPFLGFFLTRALGHAVNERIRKSTLGSIIRN